MNQRVVLVTGASSGIGSAIALQAARRGFAVVVTARRAERLAALVKQIEQAGGRALALPGDITMLADQRRIVDETIRQWGRLDILVNNAGVPLPAEFTATSPEELQRQWSTNVSAPATLTRIAQPYLAQQRGIIVNVGSSISRVAMPGWGNYAATKIAMAGLNRALRRELHAQGIRVCLVEPGPVATEFGEQADWAANPPYSITADACAASVVRLFDHPRQRIVTPGWLAIPLLFVGALESSLPWLVDLVLRHISVSKLQGKQGRSADKMRGKAPAREDFKLPKLTA